MHGKTVRREGKQTIEYLAQVGFTQMVDSHDRARSVCNISPPLPLTKTKTCPAIFAVEQGSWKSLREMGHRGIAVEHFCYDRAVYSALTRLHKQDLSQKSAKHDNDHKEAKALEQLE